MATHPRIPELAAYSILIPHLVGYINSKPKPKGFNYTMHEKAEAVKALIDAVGVKGDILLIPHNMGGPLRHLLRSASRPTCKRHRLR